MRLENSGIPREDHMVQYTSLTVSAALKPVVAVAVPPRAFRVSNPFKSLRGPVFDSSCAPSTVNTRIEDFRALRKGEAKPSKMS